MVTVHIRAPNGEPLYDGIASGAKHRAPVTITVTPLSAPPTRLPLGARRRAVHPVLSRESLRIAVDHVVAWQGWRVEPGKPPLACTRENVYAVLEGRPDVAEQVLAAIKAAPQPGSAR